MIKMNLQEMINYINSNKKTINLEDLPNQDFGFYLFKRLTYAISTYEVEQCSICFVVKDRGLKTETAYVKGGFPAYLKPESFRDRVEDNVNTIMSKDASIEGYKFGFIDNDRQIAEIIGYIYDSNTKKISEKKFMVIDVAGTLHFREFA